MSRPKQGKLVVILPVECRPEFFTAFPLSNDLAQGGLFVYPDGEIRHWKPDDEVTVPDRHIPPSQRDLSTHGADCTCMGCFYADDRATS